MSYRMIHSARRLMCDKFSILCTIAELNAKEAKEDEGMTKTPLGLMPKKLWNEKRAWQISEAIERYINACMPIPIEWVEEYNELMEAIK